MMRPAPSRTPHLFAPLELKAHRLENRLVVAPMSRVSTRGDGIPTERMAEYYAAFGDGEFGLVITEGTYTDRVASQGYPNQPGLTSASQAEGWGRVVERVRRSDARFVAQLMHAGALTQLGGVRPVAPSAVAPKGGALLEYGGEALFRMPRAALQSDLQTIVEGFRAAARFAQQAGFDGVEIHAANGYLLDQFLTDYTNRRSDRYGAGLEGRVRFPAEIVETVRGAVDARFIVGVRISQAKVNDFSYTWPGGIEEAVSIAAAFTTAGADYIHLAGEGRGWRDAVREDGATASGAIRRRVGVPVIVNGGLEDPNLADGVLADGHADLIALGRAAIATPDWPRRVRCGVPVEPFVPEMLQPKPTIENTDAWAAARSTIRRGPAKIGTG